MKILAFAASSSKQSINKQLVTHAVDVLQDLKGTVQSEVLDINDYEMPLFSLDREAEFGQPDLATKFFRKIGDADAIIISFAEHNGSYTAAYKNLFDWVSRIDQKVYQGKETILLSTSPGAGGAQSVLKSAEISAPFFGANVKASLSVPNFFDNFDIATGRLKNSTIEKSLRATVSALS
ncbi:NADPH-dependent FMN reductase [Alphaproteobacteria bacterium 46_93_T64]|nr:NADPH-dependent FMN reductase [Alphaproteobacteria bacterium 46_93_T64]